MNEEQTNENVNNSTEEQARYNSQNDYNNQNNYNYAYQYQPQMNAEPVYEKDGYAVPIMVLGILSLVCCAPCGIVALVLRAVNKDQISPEKQGYVTAGFVTSIVGLICQGLGILVGFAVFAF